jgi:hypothetical protein
LQDKRTEFENSRLKIIDRLLKIVDLGILFRKLRPEVSLGNLCRPLRQGGSACASTSASVTGHKLSVTERKLNVVRKL